VDKRWEEREREREREREEHWPVCENAENSPWRVVFYVHFVAIRFLAGRKGYSQSRDALQMERRGVRLCFGMVASCLRTVT
jgi:hypothetical protein